MLSLQPVEARKIVSEQFRRLFIAYSQAINKQQGRTGSLFQKNFKRKSVNSDSYFTNVVHYIHANPQIHGIVMDYPEYPHSSYGRILLDRPSKLKRKELFERLGGNEEYVKFHTDDKATTDVKSGFVI